MSSEPSIAPDADAPPMNGATAQLDGDAPPGLPERKLFGTFGGVFTPTLLTILGVIMYLREGWVIGNAGLLESNRQALMLNERMACYAPQQVRGLAA